MTKKIILPLVLLAILMTACTQDKPSESTTAPNEQNNASISDQTMTPVEQLRSVALDEGDYVGRVRNSFISLQDEYNKAQEKFPELGKSTVFVDDRFVLLIKNEKDGEVLETKVDLHNLNPEDGGMMLVPDQHLDEFPGIKVFALDGKPGVQHFKNGKLESEERFLEIYLPERSNIERIAPALSQALMIAHGKI